MEETDRKIEKRKGRRGAEASRIGEETEDSSREVAHGGIGNF